MLGWNDGTDREIFSREELVEIFSMERVHKAGAKFDYEKAKWYNHEWIKQSGVGSLELGVRQVFNEHGIMITDDALFKRVIGLVKDRCTLLPDFLPQVYFFFQSTVTVATECRNTKWSDTTTLSFL